MVHTAIGTRGGTVGTARKQDCWEKGQDCWDRRRDAEGKVKHRNAWTGEGMLRGR
jgi:hypothetical protein